MEEEEALLTEPLTYDQDEKSRGVLSRIWHTDYFPCIPARYMLAIAACLGFVNVYALRVNLSVAIVEMADSTATVRNGSARTFDWTSAQEGQILAAFFYGYIITQIPGGLIAQRFGGRWVFGVGVVMTAVLTLFTPIAAEIDYRLLITLRALEGFFEGVTFPAMHALWGKWAPSEERSRLATITYAGPHIGTVLSFPISALLVQYGFAGGWPSVFYVFGAVGILWFFLWLVVGHNSPASHPRISREEKEYIESSIDEQEVPPIPWLHIAKSPAVWAIIIAHFCNNWGFYTLLTCMPTYFKQALPDVHLGEDSIVLAGVFSAIPYFLLASLVFISGVVADFLRNGLLSTTVVRKIMTITAFSGSASFLLLCAYLGTTTLKAVSLLTIGVGSLGIAIAGFNINHIDIAPRYSGLLMGITNMAATLPGFLGPIVAKSIAREPPFPKYSDAYNNAYRNEWREIFIISAELYIFGIFIYLMLASGEKQYWADGVPSIKDREKLRREGKQSQEACDDTGVKNGGLETFSPPPHHSSTISKEHNSVQAILSTVD